VTAFLSSVRIIPAQDVEATTACDGNLLTFFEPPA
jgi:hypothetical protein